MDLDAGLDIKPDLDKAPPHVEGDLLKRKTNKGLNILSKAWQRRFFVVHKDKLQYYAKKEDYKSGKEPLNSVRLLKVKDITESVFNGVPKRHHINCGFTVIELLKSGEEVVYHLLAETPDLMRYWVHALRYVRSYWSKLEVRDTVINEDHERKLLERILREEESDDIVIVGEYSVDDDHTRQGSADWDNKQLCIPVHFADGSKTLVYVSVSETISSVIEKVRDKLTSSASQIWIVNNEGKEISLKPNDSVILYHPSAHQFFLVDPNSRIIVVFIGKEFVATIVPLKITAQEVIEDHDVATKLDIAGITNRGLFLQKGTEELLFDSSECPCEALFIESSDGNISRRDIGSLVIKNKTMEHRSSKILRQSIRKATVIPSPSAGRRTPVPRIIEEEDHKRALDKIQQLRDGRIKKAPQIVEESPRIRTRSKAFISKSSESENNDKDGELNVSTDSEAVLGGSGKGGGRGEGGLDLAYSSPKPSPRGSPKPSPRGSPKPSPRHVISTKPSPPTTKRQGKTVTKKQVRRADEVGMEESRSSGFGRFPKAEEPKLSDSEEERLSNLFSVSYQEKEEQELKEKLETKLSSTLELQASSNDDVFPAPTSPSPPPKPFILTDSLITKPQTSCVVIHRPALLKVVLLQSEAEDTKDSNQAIKRISLSGVVLNYSNTVWTLDEESQYHDEASIDSEGESDQREYYTLPGGIRSIYDPTGNSWTVLPPLPLPSPLTPTSPSSLLAPPSLVQAEAQVNNSSPDLYTTKRAIATNIGAAFMEILGLFKGSLSLDEKKKIASDMTNETIGHMIRGRFCTSVAYLLLDGVKLQKLGGLIQYDVWKLVSSFCQEGLTTSDPTVTSVAVDMQVMRPIKGESRLVTNDMKFRSFICLAISRGIFIQWLSELPTLGDTIRKHYGKSSFLYMVYNGDKWYCKLYDEILLSLQPISFFPFQLSIDFEIKSSSPSTSSLSSSAGELVREQPVKSNGIGSTVSPSQSLSEQDPDNVPTSLINESHVLSMREESPISPPPETGLLLNNVLKGKSTPQWFKSITSNLANLNIGGVLSGPPAQPSPLNSLSVRPTENEPPSPAATPSPPSPPPPPPSQPNWKVVALYDCFADNEDELSFNKGEILQVVKEIDSDWLFCEKDDKKGIVPLLFVQKCT